MSFTAEIGHYVGATSDYTTEIAQWLTDGVKTVVSRIGALAPDMLEQFATTAAITDGNGVNLAAKGRVLMVERDASSSANANDDLRTAKPVKLQFKNQLSSTTSLYYAPPEDPKYYVEAGTLYIKPTPSAAEAGVVHHVTFGAVDDTNETIAYFPDEFKKHVVLWVAMNVLHAKMIDTYGRLPTDLDADQTTFDAISDFSDGISMTTGLPSAVSVSSSLPSAISVSTNLPSAFSVSSSLPSAISVSTDLPSDFSITSEVGTLPALKAMPSISSEVADALTNAKNFMDNAASVGVTTDVEDWLNNEDVEMVDSTLQAISTELQRANTHLAQHQDLQQSEMNDWRQEVEQYQAVVQSEVQGMQAQLAKYQADLAKESAQMQEEVSKYQAEVSKESQRTQVDVSRYQAELAKESAQMQEEIGKYQAELSKEQARIQAEMSKYQGEVQKESARVQSELAEYQANVARKFQSYSAKIQKETTAYQWLQTQLQYVQQMHEQCWAPYQGAMTDQNTSYARPRK